MSNFESYMVTEHTFQVKDPQAFIEEMCPYAQQAHSCDFEGLCYYQESDGSFWVGGYDADLMVDACMDMEEETETFEEDEVNVAMIIQQHLCDGEYAMISGVGHEKLVDVGGWVCIVTQESILYGDLSDLVQHLTQGIVGITPD